MGTFVCNIRIHSSAVITHITDENGNALVIEETHSSLAGTDEIGEDETLGMEVCLSLCLQSLGV